MSRERAAAYMRSYGNPAESSKRLLVDVLKRHVRARPMRVLELGCGNGQIYEYLLERGVEPLYVGVDFSSALLDVARVTFEQDDRARWVLDDVNTLEAIDERFDVAIY